MPPITSPSLLTYAQVCEHLQVSRSTAERLARAGLLTKIHIGGCVRFNAEDIEAFVRIYTGDR